LSGAFFGASSHTDEREFEQHRLVSRRIALLDKRASTLERWFNGKFSALTSLDTVLILSEIVQRASAARAFYINNFHNRIPNFI